jgi:ABC-type lipoprotein export system ATPase subunit
MPPEPARTVSDVTCLACGCLCDDIVATVAGGRIIAAANACERGRAWFLAERPTSAAATIEGQPVAPAQARDRARELLSTLDVGHRAQAQVPQLSGGEQQRVAIARALVNQPPIILADEPTAPLDSERALTVMRILNEMAQRFRTAIIVVTHDEKIIPTFRRIYHIRDGRTYEQAGEARAA